MINLNAKNEVLKHILNIISKHVNIPLYTTRPENISLPYIRVVQYTGFDLDYKNIEQGYVRVKFNIYSADESLKEVSEISGKIEETIKAYAYDSPYIAKLNIEDLWITDVNKPDVRQGEVAYRFKYYY